MTLISVMGLSFLPAEYDLKMDIMDQMQVIEWFRFSIPCNKRAGHLACLLAEIGLAPGQGVRS
ncbi:hypothetical protein [Deinococcus roseus]|uniref:hypothetical protein n=1 Tax=Deinococcus roseus TaxID=392414 RepID=UPI001664BA90|nr:hypothetical protein [Deinococcus roseus]